MLRILTRLGAVLAGVLLLIAGQTGPASAFGGETLSITGDWTSVITGCGSTDAYCTVATGGSNADREVRGTVTYTQNGQSATRSSFAIIRWYCGSSLC